MTSITTSILLGVTAALANAFGGAVIVQQDWDKRYLRYFVALGAGFMLGTALLEMLPESIHLAGPNAPLLLLTGYFIVHFFEQDLGAAAHAPTSSRSGFWGIVRIAPRPPGHTLDLQLRGRMADGGAHSTSG